MLVEGTIVLQSNPPNSKRLKLGKSRLIRSLIWYPNNVRFICDIDDNEELKEALVKRFEYIIEHIEKVIVYLENETIIFTIV